MLLRNACYALAGLGMLAATVGATPAHAVLVVNGGPVNASVFTAAGLDGTWDFQALPQVFGTGGGTNGFNPTTATYELRAASYGHQFGWADNGDHSPSGVIFDSSVSSPPPDVTAPINVSGVGTSYLFYFRTICDNCSNDAGYIFSDGDRDNDPNNQLNMAIYKSGNVYALFFDDGGGCTSNQNNGNCNPNVNGQDDDIGGFTDDNDYNDMVVTVRTASVPEPLTLGLLGAGLLGLGFAAQRRRS